LVVHPSYARGAAVPESNIRSLLRNNSHDTAADDVSAGSAGNWILLEPEPPLARLAGLSAQTPRRGIGLRELSISDRGS